MLQVSELLEDTRLATFGCPPPRSSESQGGDIDSMLSAEDPESCSLRERNHRLSQRHRAAHPTVCPPSAGRVTPAITPARGWAGDDIIASLGSVRPARDNEPRRTVSRSSLSDRLALHLGKCAMDAAFRSSPAAVNQGCIRDDSHGSERSRQSSFAHFSGTLPGQVSDPPPRMIPWGSR